MTMQGGMESWYWSSVNYCSVAGIKLSKRRLLYIPTLQDILDLTVQNDVICNYTRVVMLSMYLESAENCFSELISQAMIMETANS